MDVRIGVTYTAKEIEVDLGDDGDGDAVQADVDKAITGETAVLWLTDKKGRRFGVPTERIAYVEIGSSDEARRIGFGA